MDQPALSIILATRNRAAVLSDTLLYMHQMDREGLQVNFVIIDNGSSDDTATVIKSFRDRLDIQYLFEGKPGKNVALNRALNEAELHPLVVFTDDDVKPRPDWLRAIVAASDRWPDHAVFGGKIIPTWPADPPPRWVHDKLIQQIAFAGHDLGLEERIYASNEQPFGPNFWIRRDVLTPDMRFDVSFGPGTGTLGDESMFLRGFQKKGYEIVYSPYSCVEHRIQADGLCLEKLPARAEMVGRIGPNMYGLCNPERLRRNPFLWRLQRRIRLNQARLAWLWTRLHPNPDQRIIRGIQPLIDKAYNLESLRLTRRRSNRIETGSDANSEATGVCSGNN